MSVAVIDQDTYKQLEILFVTQWIDQGMDLIAARRLVADQMQNCFICNEVVDLHDDTLDQLEKGIYS